jgi:hypothetical protein
MENKPIETLDISQLVRNSYYFPECGNASTSNRAIRSAIYTAFEMRDFYSGQQLSKDEMVIDHLIPVSKNGPDNIFNYIPTTRRLNNKKINRVDNLMIIFVLNLIRERYSKRALEIFLNLKQQSESNEVTNLPSQTLPPHTPLCRPADEF